MHSSAKQDVLHTSTNTGEADSHSASRGNVWVMDRAVILFFIIAIPGRHRAYLEEKSLGFIRVARMVFCLPRIALFALEF